MDRARENRLASLVMLALLISPALFTAACRPGDVAVTLPDEQAARNLPLAEPTADWPVVRGDAHGSGVAIGDITAGLDVLWTYRAGEDAGIEATAVIADGVVYVGDTEGTMHAVQLSDGKRLWAKSFEDGGFNAGAAVDKAHGRLFVGDVRGTVRCLATADGEELWSAKVEAEVFAGPSPVDDMVLFTSEAGTLTSFDAASGEERWKFQIDAPLRCSPTSMDATVMLAGCDSLLHGVNIANGKELFTVEIDGPTGATPAMRGNRVYFGTEGGTFFAIDANPREDRKPAVAWIYRDPERGHSIRAAAAVTDDIVVYSGQGKAVYGLDAATGEEKWKLPTRTRVDSSPVIIGQRVLAATVSGKIQLLELSTGTSQWESDFGGGFSASPAVAGNRIVLGNTDGTLYCFGTAPDKQEYATDTTNQPAGNTIAD
jgi:outer membrane protein assembly factor BamB